MTMVDDEVEIVLREIRERVISQTRTEQMAPSKPTAGNGSGALIGIEDNETSSAAELARLEGYLTTTGRAWDRLPPVFSNRTGALARVELWFKARAKSLARWFTWEQVNFNAAVNHALRETREALLRQHAAFDSLRAGVPREGELRDAEFEKVAVRLAEIGQRIEYLAAESDAKRIEIQTLRAELHGEAEARRMQIEDTNKQLNALVHEHERRQATQVRELSERDDLIENEHRASFKQLSLESSEAAAFHSTSRRKLESAIAELDRRISLFESAMKQGK
jgi:hypothetical protein